MTPNTSFSRSSLTTTQLPGLNTLQTDVLNGKGIDASQIVRRLTDTESFASILEHQSHTEKDPTSASSLGYRENTRPISNTSESSLENLNIGGAFDSLNKSKGLKSENGSDPLQETFQQFVGQTFFGQMIASMRSTQGESAYFNGGRAEKIFQGQLDQMLSEEMTKSSAKQIAEPMYALFQAQRSK